MLRAVDQKHLESFEMWCWRKMEKISWTDHVRNEEVLLRVKEQRNILHEIRKRKANCIGHILRRNCLLQRVIEGKIKGGLEVTGRRGRRLRKLLDDLKERRGYSHLKEEALDRTMWRARFGRAFGPVVRQTTKWMNEYIYIFICLFIYLFTSMGTRRCPGCPMAKPDSNFVYYIKKRGDVINCGNVSEWNMCHVTYERVHNLPKITHVQEEEGSIVSEDNVLFDN